MAVGGLERALVADHENVERLLVAVRIKAEAQRKMSGPLGRFLDSSDLRGQSLFERPGVVRWSRL
jgi:hypothetical protein